MTIRLNIGAGALQLEGWTAIDRKLGSEAYPLDYGDESVDEICASHILEHFGIDSVAAVLDDWTRVLKPGGRIRVAVPDFDKVAAMRLDDPQWSRLLMGAQADADDYHRSVFSRSTLWAALDQAGLERIGIWTANETLDSSGHPCSLNLQAFKPVDGAAKRAVEPDPKPKQITVDIKIAAVMSLPRVGWNDHWGCTLEALRPFSIPVRRYTGAFWGQCLQNVLEDCVADGLDWVLTLDYDTMFTTEHLDRMLGHFGNNPQIDALAALQCRRRGDTPLMTIGGATKVETDGSPIRVSTAHFGMTLLRVERIAATPKPWFKGEPGPDGSWRHNERLDPDIWFWHQWRKADHTVYVAPDVRVGHLEIMVSDFDESLNARHMTVEGWRNNQKVSERCT